MSLLRRGSLGPAFGYAPGEQPPGAGGWIKLNTNESPLPPSAGVAGAVAAAAAELHRYPDPDCEPLRSAIAVHHGVRPVQVLVANGGDEVLDCCLRAFCEPGDTLVLPVPTYSLLEVMARVASVRVHALPLEDWQLPAAFGTTAGALRVAVNPNSPTGCWVSPSELGERLGSASGVVVIDEAYCDFAPASCIPLLGGFPHWLVVRTFSKSYALAGLRVGYAVGAAPLIEDLRAVRSSYPVDRCAIAGAGAALADTAHHRAIVELVRSERDRVRTGLVGLGMEVLASEANFLFARPPGDDAAAVMAALRRQRVLVRHFPGALAAWLRITVGTPDQNDALLEALQP